MDNEESLCRRKIAWLRWLLIDASNEDQRPTIRQLLEDEEARLSRLTGAPDEKAK
jgi:hypothetical protein